ncbi:MAG: hypothetical protein ACNA8J_00225 [Gammaproteobacteria bacterium]
MSSVRSLQIAVLAIASVFVARALLRLWHPEFNILRFAVLGWAPWTVWAISAAELLGAVLLLKTPTFRLGVAVLAAVSGAFLVTYARIGVPEAGLGSAGLLAALGGLYLLRQRGVTTG